MGIAGNSGKSRILTLPNLVGTPLGLLVAEVGQEQGGFSLFTPLQLECWSVLVSICTVYDRYSITNYHPTSPQKLGPYTGTSALLQRDLIVIASATTLCKVTDKKPRARITSE